MRLLNLIVGAVVLIGLSGCGTKMTMPYVMKTDRVDQSTEGNRGFLKGNPPPAADRSNLKREWLAVDIDLPPTTKEREAMEAKTTK